MNSQPTSLTVPLWRNARVLTWLGFGTFLVALGVSIAVWGLPWSRDRLAGWLILGLLAVSLSDLRAWARGIVLDWMPVLALLFTYDLLRGYADELAPTAHTFPQLRADEWLFGGTVPTVWLQQHFYDPANPAWYDVAAWLVYTSHFFIGLAVAAVLWRVAYHRFRRYVALFLSLTMAGFATYVLFPAVPPWLASQNGDLEQTTRLVGYIWAYVGVDAASTIFSGGNRYANDVAALPSLHAAYPFLLTLFFWRDGWGARVLLCLYTVAMAVTLVYTAEHYVSDILLGWIYAAVVFAVGMWIVRWRARRADERSTGRIRHAA